MIDVRHDYWAVRYLPNPVRGEFVNVGVVAGRGSDWAVLSLPESGRARALAFGSEKTLAAALDYLDNLRDDIAAGTLDSVRLERDRINFNNVIQLSSPYPVLGATAVECARLLGDILLGGMERVIGS